MASSRMTESSAFSRWRRRRRMLREARHLRKEVRRILRKYRYRIREEVAAEVTRATDALGEALSSRRVAAVQERTEKLERLVDKHLSFGRKSALREYAESIGVAVLIALLLRAFVVEAFKIPSGSMIPTLDVGDHIFVNKFIYGLRLPLTNVRLVKLGQVRRGEVIVFVYPNDESKDFIKRVVAIGGDTISLQQNVIVLNGHPIKRRRLPGPCIYSDAEEGSSRWEPRPCVAFEEELDGNHYRVIQDLNSFAMDRRPRRIPLEHVFVMGDNRDNSHDSRFWGPVPDNFVKGKAMVIWWSSGEPDGIRWSRFFHLVHAPPDLKPLRPGH